MLCNCTVPQDTLDRLRETFRRLSTSSGYLPQATFLRDVLGESVPAKLADVSWWGVVEWCDVGWGYHCIEVLKSIMFDLCMYMYIGDLHCIWRRQ